MLPTPSKIINFTKFERLETPLTKESNHQSSFSSWDLSQKNKEDPRLSESSKYVILERKLEGLEKENRELRKMLNDMMNLKF